MRRLALLAIPLVGGALLAFRPSAPVGCDGDNGGLILPKGYCASLFATLPGARHVAVAPNGDVFVTSQAGRGGAGLFALRDRDKDGKSDTTVRISTVRATGVALSNDAIYFTPDDRVIRYSWKPGQLAPSDTGTVIVGGLPAAPGHTAKTITVGKSGELFVDIGSPDNVCSVPPVPKGQPVPNPLPVCADLVRRAGIWKFDGKKVGQTVETGERWVTGFRNGMALAVEPTTGVLWGATHGRDELKLWPGYTNEDSAEQPAEEFGILAKGNDYGYPYCYYNPITKKKMLAPEYGGDNVKQGDCGAKTQPVIGFPGHWAPLALAFNNSGRFGDLGAGAFLAFHGSWNRAPLAQAGFRVVFIPFKDGKATGTWSTFATGPDGEKSAGGAGSVRPAGVAVMADGSAMFIAADAQGKIWRVIPQPK